MVVRTRPSAASRAPDESLSFLTRRSRLPASAARPLSSAAADTDATLAVHAIYAYITGIMHEWTLEPSAYDLLASAPALVDTFLAGLVAHPPRVRAAAIA